MDNTRAAVPWDRSYRNIFCFMWEHFMHICSHNMYDWLNSVSRNSNTDVIFNIWNEGTTFYSLDKKYDREWSPSRHKTCDLMLVLPLKPSRCIKASFYIPENILSFPTTKVLERKFPWNWLINTWRFSLIFKPHQVFFIHYQSRLVVDERTMANSGSKGPILKQHTANVSCLQ